LDDRKHPIHKRYRLNLKSTENSVWMISRVSPHP